MIQSKIKSVRGGESRRGDPTRNTERVMAVQIPDDAPSISIMDESNHYSLINLVPPAFADRMRRVPRSYWSMPEQLLHDEVKPDDVLNKLKLRFWDEWQTSIIAGITARVSITAVYYGVCTEEYFHEHVLTSPKNMAWVLTPPTDYVLTMRDILRQGLQRLREVIQLPIITQDPIIFKGQPVRDNDGTILKKTVIQKGVITEIRQIVQLLSDRVHGAVVQRLDVQQKSLTMEVSPETAHLLASASPAASHMISEGGRPISIEAHDQMNGFTSNELMTIEAQLSQINNVLTNLQEQVVVDDGKDTEVE